MDKNCRRRRSSKKSKTGCRTCRLRHVKCDETPGMCQRCTSTGRKCDGYDAERLPNRRTTATLTELAPDIARRFRWKLTSDEQRCISFFQNRIGPSIVAYFDCVLWQRLVLQLSQVEPAAFHALVAFSAVYADYEARGIPVDKDDMDNTLQRFALDQCARAYRWLNSRSASQDPGFRDIMLVCCVLFIMVEWMRGQYDTATIHLKNGLRILEDDQTLTAATAAFSSVFGQCLGESLASLKVQSTYFGIEEPTQPQSPKSSDPGTPVLDDKVFHSLLDARLTFEPLMGEIFQFHLFTSRLSEEHISFNYSQLSDIQFELSSRLNRFSIALESFRLSSFHQLSLNAQRSLHTMQLHQQVLSIVVHVSLIANEHDALDFYSSSFEHALSLAESIIASFADRPSVCLDMGVILPLSFVATRCREPDIRARALEVLRSWPHREGPWESSFIADCASRPWNSGDPFLAMLP
ncbi:transcriptional regulator family: Fungal Specific TF [Aspergillus niger]|uniref:Contig An02c0440, genomic contig n=3 Tax=Aspergillus niger TaxID=5061 RepID=A2QF49_ASPNC|nr:uncharacterized protein An02g13290 [Aspergillus niger]RDH23298.1 hypothetical protein M747DRAFT_275759 [Aspergillus niger ATCC 13496]KAI2816655.1 transcriptional regulator family: Fungal Specific TF [Aspergillus niger]KAI2834450.1 transcriptional regulator family: Fungal Specific TF [Aspergillus niger]KAI2868179.1 transcriptional regulator family: Fungal Specific TF [Aspergillus niger]CAK47742.1 unnamed protein product [Aspergillus niger]|eukprot:XP_001400460.1 C6 zinc finger domain protein [Aspergillus niger CBS 513.88]